MDVPHPVLAGLHNFELMALVPANSCKLPSNITQPEACDLSAIQAPAVVHGEELIRRTKLVAELYSKLSKLLRIFAPWPDLLLNIFQQVSLKPIRIKERQSSLDTC